MERLKASFENLGKKNKGSDMVGDEGGKGQGCLWVVCRAYTSIRGLDPELVCYDGT